MPKFIKSEAKDLWFDIDDHPVLYYSIFCRNQYSDTLFKYYDVTLPGQLKSAVIKRRAEFLAGRYCAAKALMLYGISNFTVKIGLHRNPLWPPGFCGSISHCDDYAVAIVSPVSKVAGIGVDIEEVISEDTAQTLQSQILFDEEQSLLSHGNKAWILTLAFSVKESFFKAVYPEAKRYFNFDAVSIINIDIVRSKITLRINADLGKGLQKGKLIFGHFYSLSSTKLATCVSVDPS